MLENSDPRNLLVRTIIFCYNLCDYVAAMPYGKAEMFRAVIVGKVRDGRYGIRHIVFSVHVRILAQNRRGEHKAYSPEPWYRIAEVEARVKWTRPPKTSGHTTQVGRDLHSTKIFRCQPLDSGTLQLDDAEVVQ